jgi:DNA-binding SARP family transcriptional activator
MLSVRLFGRLSVLSENRPVPGLQTGKAGELLCFLLVHHDRTYPREALASQFWSERSTSQSRKNLRHTLWQLQNLLPTEDQNGPILTVEPDWVQLNSNSAIWVDLIEFKQGYQQVRDHAGQTLNPYQYQLAKQCAALYQGSFLAGWYQDWCILEREQRENACIEILDKLMSHCEYHQAYSEGITYGEEILRIERARERTHRHLMRLHFLAGDRTAALRQYERCQEVLRSELAAEPSRSTCALYQQILNDRLADEPEPHHTEQGPNPPNTEINAEIRDILERLYQFRSLLNQVQTFVYEDILRLEKRMNNRR